MSSSEEDEPAVAGAAGDGEAAELAELYRRAIGEDGPADSAVG